MLPVGSTTGNALWSNGPILARTVDWFVAAQMPLEEVQTNSGSPHGPLLDWSVNLHLPDSLRNPIEGPAGLSEARS